MPEGHGAGPEGDPTDAARILPVVRAAWRGGIVDSLSDYVRIECLSPLYDTDWESRGALTAAARHLADWARSRAVPGLTTEILQVPGRTPVLLIDVPGEGEQSVLIYGHLDKQPPFGDWRPGLGPYTPVKDGDFLYGRGTADDGYSAFAAVAALEALSTLGASHPPVTVLIEASEESGSPDLDAWLGDLADRLGRPALALCLDSGGLSFDRLWATASLRGNVGLTLRVDVLDEGVHSGVAGGIVPDSFRILRQLLTRIDDETTGRPVVPELYCDVPDRHRQLAQAVAAEFPDTVTGDYPAVAGLTFTGTPADQLVARAWAPALTVTGADGLPPTAVAGNVLRPFTALKLSLRLPPAVDAAGAAQAVAARLLADPPDGARVTVELDPPADGWVAPDPPDWLAGAFDEASRACFARPAGSFGEGGTIPFLATLGRRLPGVPLVATGVLGPHTNHHGPNECLSLPMAEAVSVFVACALRALPDT